MKPTPKKVIVSTIGRDYKTQKLRPPQFEDATYSDVSYGRMSNILDELAIPPSKMPAVEEAPVKISFLEAIKKLVPSRISELVTVQ